MKEITEETPIKYLGELQKINIKPGDKLVFMSEHALSIEERKNIKEILKKQFSGLPPNSILILEKGFKFGVISHD